MLGADDDDVVVPNNRKTCSGDIGRFLFALWRDAADIVVEPVTPPPPITLLDASNAFAADNVFLLEFAMEFIQHTEILTLCV